jgi:hypothetical protein
LATRWRSPPHMLTAFSERSRYGEFAITKMTDAPSRV